MLATAFAFGYLVANRLDLHADRPICISVPDKTRTAGLSGCIKRKRGSLTGFHGSEEGRTRAAVSKNEFCWWCRVVVADRFFCTLTILIGYDDLGHVYDTDGVLTQAVWTVGTLVTLCPFGLYRMNEKQVRHRRSTRYSSRSEGIDSVPQVEVCNGTNKCASTCSKA